jgi:hypothetical protein
MCYNLYRSVYDLDQRLCCDEAVDHFDIGIKRIQPHSSQPDLFQQTMIAGKVLP